MPLPFCRCRSSYVRFRCRFVNIQRNWMEINFRSDERQAAQTSILDEANVAGDLTSENLTCSEKCMITITSHSSDILEYDTFAI